MDEDFLLAIQLQEQFDNEYETSLISSNVHHDDNEFEQSNKKRKVDSGGGGVSSSDVVPYSRASAHPERPLSIVDETWEMLDPSPDVRAMFLEFNDKFFWGKLFGVEVKWSPRMTLCAGLCSYEGRGGLCSIRLSEPLLKLRSRRELVETLLHEMIHALLFVTQNNRDRDGHGPEFCKHMNRINEASGTKITVYHSFHDEVDMYRQHWWRCNGPCQTRKPYFGFVKRAMNRAPSAQDPWWGEHQRTCGGAYTKVKEPEGYGKKDKKNTKKNDKPSTTANGSRLQDIRNIIPFSGTGFLLGGTSKRPSSTISSSSSSSQKPPDPSLSKPILITSSPEKPSFYSPSQTEDLRSPVWPGVGGPLSGTSSALPSITGGASRDKKPPVKRSVGNTRAFVNINGSPVRIPKPAKSSGRGTSTSKPRSDGTSGSTTIQRSLQDFFKTRGLQSGATGSSSASISKPPAETDREVLSPGSALNLRQQTDTSKASSPDSIHQANHCNGHPTGSKLSSVGYKFPSGFPTTSVSSPTKPHLSKYASAVLTESTPSPTKPEPSSDTKPGGAAGGVPASRKRPWDDRVSVHVSDFFQNTESSDSAAAKECSRAKGSSSAATGGKRPAVQHRADTSSSFTSSSSVTTSSSALSSSSGLYNAVVTSSSSGLYNAVVTSSSLSSSSGLYNAVATSSSFTSSSSVTSSSSSLSSSSGLYNPVVTSSSLSSSGLYNPVVTSSPSLSSSSGLYNTVATSSSATLTVSCPVCQAKVQESKINEHLDSCLS